MTSLDRQLNIIDLALSSLLRRRFKNILLFLVYTLIVFILASIVFFTSAIKREASMVLKDTPDVVIQRLIAGRHDLIPQSYITKMGPIIGSHTVRGRLWGYYYEPVTGANYTIMAAEAGKVGTGQAIVGTGVARTLKIAQGDTIPLKTYDGAYQTLDVASLFPAESELVSSDLIIVSEDDFRALFGIPAGFYTDLTLKVRNPRELAVVADKIRRLLPDTRPILKEEILRTYSAIFDWRGGLLLIVFSAAALAFAIFAWDKATSLSMEERREIGILKAVGWETSEVLAMKSWEGVIISLSAFLVGLILAYAHVFFASSALFSPVLKGWAVLYPEFRLTPFIDLYQLASLFFLTVVPYTVATIIPSWAAATVDPDRVMRY